MGAAPRKRPAALRLDALLVERGLFRDEKTAQGWIMAGKVRVEGRYETKAGTRVPIDAEVEVRGLDQPYVSRGGLKLEGALHRFGLDVRGKIALDAGASTGGFTDCLLQHGAARVYAVDVGHGQLRGKLASDPRVVSLERTNIGDLGRGTFEPPIELCVADLSYLSLRSAIPILAALFEEPGPLICLVKPLFEGVPESEKAGPSRMPAVFAAIAHACARCDLELLDLAVSPILGRRESLEFFARIGVADAATPPLEALSRRALDEAEARFPELAGA